MLEIYLGLPSWIRYSLATPVVVAGLWLGIAGATGKSDIKMQQDHPDRAIWIDRRARNNFRVGFSLTCFGCILLALAARSPSEKAGYHCLS